MASISFVKRPRYVKWLGALAFLCIYAALIAQLSMLSKQGHAGMAPHEKVRTATAHHSPSPKALAPISAREQLLDAARWFEMGDEDELAFAADNFDATTPDIPKPESLGEVRGVTVSPRGEIRSVGPVAIPRGAAYRYVLVGPGAEHIFVELRVRGDGTREFGYGPYRE